MESFIAGDSIEKLNTKRIALLDSDFISYIVCDRRRKQLLEEQVSGAPIGILNELPIITLLDDWLASNMFGKIADPILFCFSGKSYNTFRNHIAIVKEYKGTRKSKEEAYAGENLDRIEVIKYIIKKYPSLLFEDLEADDIVSALQDSEWTYIISKDKDLKQVPGFHYDFQTNSIYEISNIEAITSLAYQMLAGDTVDCIPGFPKMGEVKSNQFLEKHKEKPSLYIQKILRLYQENFGVVAGCDMFVENWNLLKTRIDRGDHFRMKYKKMFDTKEYMVNRLKIIKT